MNSNFLLIAPPTELAEHMRLNDLDNHQLNIALRNTLNQISLLQYEIEILKRQAVEVKSMGEVDPYYMQND